MKQALLIIDVQRILCEGREAAFDVDRVIDRINIVSRKARAARAPVIVVQHEDQGPLAHGTDGWQLSARLETQPTDVFLRKRATDSFHQTELQSVLQQRGVTNLIICGLQSDFCVDTTTRRALALGYPVILVADGHSTLDNSVLTAAQISAHHTVTLANIESFGPRVTPVAAGDVEVRG